VKRLRQATLPGVAAGVRLPAYDRSALRPGIVHLGLGAFHRAHQAVYTDEAIARAGGDWGIVGVSLRSDSVARQLRPQDGLYSVVAVDDESRDLGVVGAVLEVLVAPQDPAAVAARIADPSIHIVTLTVTEKGYALGADGHHLDLDHPDVRADLEDPWQPRTAIGLLALGLCERQAAGGAPLTVLSCDNLTGNGARLRGALAHYLGAVFPDVLPWLDAAVSFPNTMVDRIVPAQPASARAARAQELGLEDAAAVTTEPFRQWFIEDDFAGPRPAWDTVGVQLVASIAPYEDMKLRLLNATHSAIACCGVLGGHETVDAVMADPVSGEFIAALMNRELIPPLVAPPGIDLRDYRDALLHRFANAHLRHRCAQIMTDGSEKIGQRWLPTLQALPGPLLTAALAAWVYTILETELPVADPRAAVLLAARASTAPRGLRVKAALDCARINADTITAFEPLVAAIEHSLDTLARAGLHALLSASMKG
jgi:fructuronate reductase